MDHGQQFARARLDHVDQIVTHLGMIGVAHHIQAIDHGSGGTGHVVAQLGRQMAGQLRGDHVSRTINRISHRSGSKLRHVPFLT